MSRAMLCRALLLARSWQRAFSTERSKKSSSLAYTRLNCCRDMFECSEFSRATTLEELSGLPFKFSDKSAHTSFLRYCWREVGTSVIRLSERSSSVMLKLTARQSVMISKPWVVI
jgi:hypothetical protein